MLSLRTAFISDMVEEVMRLFESVGLSVCLSVCRCVVEQGNRPWEWDLDKAINF